MTNQTPDDPLLSIGEFSKRSQLTAKALRIYDELNLLCPSEVDPSNGYRYYSVEQLEPARLIALLRGADMSLRQIGQLLATNVDSPSAMEILDRFIADLESRQASQRILLRHVRSILGTEEPSMFTIHTRHVASQRVLSIQRRLQVQDLDEFVSKARSAFIAMQGEAGPDGPFTLIYHGKVDHDNDGPVEAIQACSQQVQPTDLVGIRTEPAHDEVFTTITKAQWSFPAILAAYDAVACSPEVLAHDGGPLSCREVYLAEPNQLESGDLVCDIAFPVM